MEEHNCNEQPSFVLIYREDKDWRIVIEEYGDHEPINYCPYCGIKLVSDE